MEPEDIRMMLTQFDQGITTKYNSFLDELKRNSESAGSKLIPDAKFIIYLKNICRYVIRLDMRHVDLVTAILKTDWLSKDKAVLEVFHRFVCELVSAQTGRHLLDVLKTIVRNFKPRIAADTLISNELVSCHNAAFAQLHQLLSDVLEMAPSAEKRLGDVLNMNYPYTRSKTINSYSQLCYVGNLLQLTEYSVELVSPELRRFALQLIVKHLIELDLKVSREELEEMDESSLEPETKVPSEDVKTLEGIMKMMLTYIRNRCHAADGSLNVANCKSLYYDLRAAFDYLLLPTHGICHVQFLLFYMCSLNKVFAEDFVNFLWAKIENHSTPSIHRQTAAAYMSSYLARARYMSTSSIKSRLKTMTDWVLRYLLFTSDIEPDPKHHGPFYAVCQSIFYIFIFRGKELLCTQKGRLFCKGLSFQRIVSCDLNPLRFCLWRIALTFSTIVRNNYLAVCDTILEKNRRCLIPEVSADGIASDTDMQVMNSFFPFDPYLLTESQEFIKNIYQEYECPDLIGVTEQDSLAVEEDFYMEFEDEEDAFRSFPFGSSNLQAVINMEL